MKVVENKTKIITCMHGILVRQVLWSFVSLPQASESTAALEKAHKGGVLVGEGRREMMKAFKIVSNIGA